ncbi:MAG: hypothetical protein KY397_06355 [Gemmatimonadetes bacterium]|nr:hypothetical protein [Gemmatimonadota bacterium]
MTGCRSVRDFMTPPKYSLWIVPPESLLSSLRQVVGEFARRCGLDSEAFLARHITLPESSSEQPIERWRVVEEVELGHPYAG